MTSLHDSLINMAVVMIWVSLIRMAAASSSIASWINPRGALIQDFIVLEGGTLTQAKFEDGEWDDDQISTPSNGLLYNISLCKSFDSSTDDIDKLLGHMFETSKSQYYVYTGGAMLASDYEFYTFGGLPTPDASNDTVEIVHGDLFPNNDAVTAFNAGVDPDWADDHSMDNVTTFLTHGSWTSAPSEKLGFWLSGLQAADGGVINLGSSEGDLSQPNTPAKKIIEVDMTVRGNASWRELEWPSMLEPRTEGALVWLPYSEKGILLAIGGIQVPSDLMVVGLMPNETYENNFMTEIAIYDIDTEEWALQQTLESSLQPSQLAQFCTAVTSSPDNTSHFVWVYGGYDGTYVESQTASDEIWVLSVPSFEWTRITEGDAAHRRQSHLCFAPNPTQMVSIGGSIEYGGNLNKSDYIDVFDFNLLEWTHKYVANTTAEFQVPDVINKQISSLSSIPSSLNSTAQPWLSKQYPRTIHSYITHNCPAGGSSEPTPTPIPKQKTPSWQTPVIAAVAAVVGVAILAFTIWWVFRKRKQSETGTTAKRRSIISWGRAVDPPAPKSEAGSAASDGTKVANAPNDYFGSKNVQYEAYEMPSNVTSPSYGVYGHGTPQLISPQSPYSGSAEVDAQGRHEIMSQSSNARESMSIRNHPMYPRSIAGEYIMSTRSESISHPSEQVMSTHNTGYVSPYELAQDRSNENLPQPPNDQILEESRAAPRAWTNETEYVQQPQAFAINDGVARTPLHSTNMMPSPDQSPVEAQRPNHHRNQSSISSNIPHLSPLNAEEDKRISRQIEALPDVQGNSESYVQHQPQRRATGPVLSAYNEQFDHMNNTWPRG